MPPTNPDHTRPFLIRAAHDYASDNPGSITLARFCTASGIPQSTIALHFGTFPEFLIAAGLGDRLSRFRRAALPTLMAEFHRVATLLGRAPTRADILQLGRFSPRTYVLKIGPWPEVARAYHRWLKAPAPTGGPTPCTKPAPTKSAPGAHHPAPPNSAPSTQRSALPASGPQHSGPQDSGPEAPVPQDSARQESAPPTSAPHDPGPRDPGPHDPGPHDPGPQHSSPQDSDPHDPGPTPPVLPLCHPATPPLPENHAPLGQPLAFRGLLHAPTTELGVVHLFGLLHDHHKIAVERIGPRFPDCHALREERTTNAAARWRRIRIEFELRSANFKAHGHDPASCDLIVCWEHDWAQCPIEVLELKTLLVRAQAA